MATPIEDYLNGLFAEDFSAKNMTSVLLKRGIEVASDESEVTTKSKELAQADLYMVLFNTFSKGGESVSKGNWKRTTASTNIGVNDRKSFLDAANKIYDKYGEAVVSHGMKDRTDRW
jgi:hypothetical protein